MTKTTTTPKKKKDYKLPKRTMRQNSMGKFVSDNVPQEVVELLDPRKQKFLEYYTDPSSPTYSNAKQSGIRAGFAEATAKNISTYPWVVQFVGRMRALDKAVANLYEDLEMPIHREFGKKKVIEPKLVTARQNAYMYLLDKIHPDFKKDTRGNKDGGGDGGNTIQINYIVPQEAVNEMRDKAIDTTAENI